MTSAKPRAVAAREFARLMARFAPFERPPAIAVAVSGGADSMALTLLADDWARSKGGKAMGLTVDHGLRADSRGEARKVAGWLHDRGIGHKTLVWSGGKPRSGVQAAARDARYALLEDWCRKRGILHLLLAHNLEDQAETFLLRLGRGSGVYGLSAMAEEEPRRGLRLLRPLLTVPRARLVVTLQAHGQVWVEDPSNRDEKYARVRARAVLAGLAPEGLEAARIADTARRLRRARAAIDGQVTGLLVAAVDVHPEGYALFDAAALRDAPEEVALRAFARLLMTISGNIYPPRLDALEALYGGLSAIARKGGRTLHGCRIVAAPRAFRGAGQTLIVVRELAAADAPVTLVSRAEILWDGRFRVHVRQVCAVGALGAKDWAAIRSGADTVLAEAIPAPARLTLPAFRDASGVVAVPHLGFLRRGTAAGRGGFAARFAPMLGLTS
jgi:tRNA(Ile)-lysidine synthase